MTIDVALRKRVPGFELDVAFASAERVTALFGRSGSGKSMTLALVAGLLRPDGGHVRIGGTVLVDVAAGRSLPTQRRRVGFVFQDAQLFPHLSVRQNLLFGRWFARGRPTGDGVAFEQVVETLGIGGLLGRRPGRLSGGEKQRVAIGRALLARPALLLFDEPLAALDRQRRLEILPLIERLRDEFAIPIIFVSHALDEVVRLGGHVVVLRDGRVAAAGAAEAVLGAMPSDRRFGRASVLAATAGDWDKAFGLTALDHPAGRLWLAGRVLPRGRRVRALIRAADVSLAPGDCGPISIRSALSGTVAAVEPDGALAAVDVDLDGGGERLVALVTRRALHDLRLAPGAPVRALIKSVALDEAAVAGTAAGG